MRVLFVEDDPMNRRVVADMLKIVGAQMIEAEDAETGLRLIQDESFSLVLMDLRMPGMDGLAAIRNIRLRGDDSAGLPIIVVTADTALDIRERCLAAGADEVILKPVAMKQLFSTMGQVMVAAEKRKQARTASY